MARSQRSPVEGLWSLTPLRYSPRSPSSRLSCVQFFASQVRLAQSALSTVRAVAFLCWLLIAEVGTHNICNLIQFQLITKKGNKIVNCFVQLDPNTQQVSVVIILRAFPDFINWDDILFLACELFTGRRASHPTCSYFVLNNTIYKPSTVFFLLAVIYL